MLRSSPAWVLFVLSCGCSSSSATPGSSGGGTGGASDSGASDASGGAGGTGGAGSGGTSASGGSGGTGASSGSGGVAGQAGTGGSGGVAGSASDAGVDCADSYAVPPSGLAGWSPALSQTGSMTLTYDVNHSHDDQRGPLGFCSAAVASGNEYLALVSARFETDESPPTLGCIVDYTQADATFAQYGMCFSGGNHNIYVEVRDAFGQRVSAGFDVFYGASVDHVGDQGKPANEFPMNYAIYGDGTYGARAVYQGLASDAVTNMRMPIHHHVNYLLTFQVKTKP